MCACVYVCVRVAGRGRSRAQGEMDVCVRVYTCVYVWQDGNEGVPRVRWTCVCVRVCTCGRTGTKPCPG